jgi:hypothetical protein
VLNKPLPEEMIGNEIGKFKLEHKVKNRLFIVPKLYLLITDNNEIIVKGRSIELDLNNSEFNELYLLYKGNNMVSEIIISDL